jgi:hypothetical protein
MGGACRGSGRGKDAIRHDQGITDVTTSRSARPRRRTGMATFLRFTIGLQTLAVFLSPVTAGLLLTTPNGHSLRSAAAYTVFPRARVAQVVLGIAHVTVVHVPLGVLLFGFSLLQLSRPSACLLPPERSRRPDRRASHAGV